MKNLGILGFVFLAVFCTACKNKIEESSRNKDFADVEAYTTPLVSYDFKTLEPLLHREDDTLRIINFWATWCKPCVAELPVFKQIAWDYKDKKVKVLFVSLDFPSQVDQKLIPFIKKHKLNNVVLLDDAKANDWIPKVDESWSGSIPATLISQNQDNRFFEQGFDYAGLKDEIETYTLY